MHFCYGKVFWLGQRKTSKNVIFIGTSEHLIDNGTKMVHILPALVALRANTLAGACGE